MPHRRLRAAFAALSAAVVAGIALASSALAAAAPAAPYTELRIDGAHGSTALGEGKVVDAVGAAVTVKPSVNAVTFATTTATGSYQIGITGGAENTLTAGQTYDAGPAPTATGHVALAVTAGTCGTARGELAVHDVTRDGAGVLTSFGATLQFSCGVGFPNVAELRWSSPTEHIAFGVVAANDTSAPQTITVTAAADTTFGKATLGVNSNGYPNGDNPYYPFRILNDTCSGATVLAGATCTIDVTAHPTKRGGQYGVLTLPDSAGTTVDVVSLTAVAGETQDGSYTSIPPSRLLDTRVSGGAFSAGTIRALQITGKGGVPSTGISAAVLNVTVVSPTKAGNVVVYPTGQAVPTASTVNFNAGWTGASLTTVPVGTNGQVNIRNATGSVNIVVDVVGYYRSAASTSSTTHGGYVSLVPERLIDTRVSGQGPALAPNEIIQLAVNFNDPSGIDPYDYNAHIKAFAVNITAVGPTAPGHFRAWNGAGTPPSTSTLNFTTNRVVPNMAIVPATKCAFCTDNELMFGVLNSSTGSTHLIVDLAGLFDNDVFADSTRFAARPPTRILDMRYGLGGTTFAPGETKTITTPSTVAGDSTMSLVTTLTAAAPQQAASTTLWATGTPKPMTSNLNPYAGQYVSNMTMTDLGTNNGFDIWNSSKGSSNYIVDVLGTLETYPRLAPYSGTPVAGLAPAPSPLNDARSTTAAPELKATQPAGGAKVKRSMPSG